MGDALKISIIVPIYNAEQYLSACIESILSQTFKDFELLLIDDGSEDSSLDICKIYSRKDARIKIFSKTNEGVTASRKFGINQSSGKYICFVDADDLLPTNSLSSLWENNCDNDIVIGSYKIIEGNHKYTYTLPKSIPSQISGIDYIRYQLNNKIFHAPWAKLIKRSCFDEVTLDIPRSIFRGEDYLMNIRLGLNARKIGIIQKVVYHYIIRESSCMQTRMPSLEYEKTFDAYLIQPLIASQLYDSVKQEILHHRIEALAGLLLTHYNLDISDSFVQSVYEDARLHSSDLMQILAKVFLPYPTLFCFFFRIGKKVRII